jgi:hypothetical protein
MNEFAIPKNSRFEGQNASSAMYGANQGYGRRPERSNLPYFQQDQQVKKKKPKTKQYHKKRYRKL